MLNCLKIICIHILYHILDIIQEKMTQFPVEQPSMMPILNCEYHNFDAPWQFKEPGYQQAWYWSNKQEYSVSSIRRVKSLPPRNQFCPTTNKWIEVQTAADVLAPLAPVLQQSWNWISRINRYLSFKRNNFNYLHCPNVQLKLDSNRWFLSPCDLQI